MRIDEIDLFGPMLINGSAGSNGQIFGFSGSEITWITASSSGGDGDPGPQGPVGIGLFIPEDQIAIGGPSGLTSTVFFKTDGYNIIHGSSSVGGACNTILGSHQLIAPSSFINSIDGQYNTIIGGVTNTISLSVKSFMGGGEINSISNLSYSTILGGRENSISTNTWVTHNNTILGGNIICIQSGSGKIYGNTILNGYANTIGSGYSNSYYSAIVGSENSGFSGNITTLKYSAIIGGSGNTNCGIMYCSYQNAIIGGSNNFLSDSQNGYVVGSVFTKNSVTIASCNASMRSSNSVIVSSTGYLNFYNCTDVLSPGTTRYDHVLFTSGRVGNYSMFCAYANGLNESFYSGTFFNRSNAKGNCFVIYCGLFSAGGRALRICF